MQRIGQTASVLQLLQRPLSRLLLEDVRALAAPLQQQVSSSGSVLPALRANFSAYKYGKGEVPSDGKNPDEEQLLEHNEAPGDVGSAAPGFDRAREPGRTHQVTPDYATDPEHREDLGKFRGPGAAPSAKAGKDVSGMGRTGGPASATSWKRMDEPPTEHGVAQDAGDRGFDTDPNADENAKPGNSAGVPGSVSPRGEARRQGAAAANAEDFDFGDGHFDRDTHATSKEPPGRVREGVNPVPADSNEKNTGAVPSATHGAH